MKRNAKTIVAGVVALAISHAAMAKDIKVAVVGAMSGPVAQWGDMEFVFAFLFMLQNPVRDVV
jgi:branched-chain amino acid transport system substrate-binding protein